MLMMWSARPDSLFRNITPPRSVASTGRDSDFLNSESEHEKEIRDELEHKLSALHHLAQVHREERLMLKNPRPVRLSTFPGAPSVIPTTSDEEGRSSPAGSDPSRKLQYKCKLCGYSTSLEMTLNFHMRTSHGYQLPKVVTEQAEYEAERLNTPLKRFQIHVSNSSKNLRQVDSALNLQGNFHSPKGTETMHVCAIQVSGRVSSEPRDSCQQVCRHQVRENRLAAALAGVVD